MSNARAITAGAAGPAATVVPLPDPWPMRRGMPLRRAQIACEHWGRLSAARDNVVLLFTGLSPSAHAASSPADPSPGWWEYALGPGRPIDTDRFFVVCVNSLGSCYGSTGPASIDPASGRPYRLRFPELRVEDIAASARAALAALGVRRLRAVIGSSLGGMCALAYAVQFPQEVEHLVAISAAARPTPFAIALRSLQRELIRRDPAWRGGDYEAGEGPVEGLALARKLGIVSYRSAEEWQERFGAARAGRPPGEPFGVEFEIESYLDANARKFAPVFDANCYLYLSRAIDLFDLAAHGGSPDAAYSRVRARRALIVGVETDFLFPLWQQREIAAGLRAAGCAVDFEALPSRQGHDSFLADRARFAPVLARFFASI